MSLLAFREQKQGICRKHFTYEYPGGSALLSAQPDRYPDKPGTICRLLPFTSLLQDLLSVDMGKEYCAT